MPLETTTTAKRMAAQIARNVLGIKTLERQNNDAADFHDTAVWLLEQALIQAYEIGFNDGELLAQAAELDRQEAAEAQAENRSDFGAAGYLVMVSAAGVADWLTVCDNDIDAAEAAQDFLAATTNTGSTAWVVPHAGFFHHPKA
jgi:hypothetical protein